jgi:NTE family protein
MPARETTAELRAESRFALRRLPRLFGAILLLAGAASQSGCGIAVRNGPINAALADTANAAEAPTDSVLTTGENFEDTVVGLSFSGGGSRASAFAFGVLRELSRTQISSNGRSSPLIDQVDLVSSVSGGSVTAAYFALKGRAMMDDFEQKFLAQDAEESLHTSVVSPLNIVRLSSGGVNDSTGLQSWLDENLFKNATFGDVLRRKRPALWINASDIYNRTPFVFNEATFGALCSDLSTLPLSEAVAASAAVPLVFAPVVIRNFGDRCQTPMPEWADRALGNPNTSSILRANAEAIKRYREHNEVKYVKLLDGGLTDNLGLTGMLISRLGASAPYEPMTEREAVRMRRLLFIVVDAGRPPGGDWAKSVNTDASDLIQAVADTAVDANVRNTYDTFAAQLKSWNRELVDWRCKLPLDKARSLLDANRTWNCKDLSFHVVKVTFDQMPDPAVREKLERIPTRFKLKKENIDLLLDSAGAILRRNSAFQRFLALPGA